MSITHQVYRDNELGLVLSYYAPEKPSAESVRKAIQTLKGCFPDTPNEVFGVVLEAWTKENWSDEKINDAVINLVKTFVYKAISPANVLSYDKTKKLHSYNQMIEKVNKYGAGIWNEYEKVEIKGRIYYVEIENF